MLESIFGASLFVLGRSKCTFRLWWDCAMLQRVKGVNFELRERRERERERAAGRCHQLVKAMRVSRHTKLALPHLFQVFF